MGVCYRLIVGCVIMMFVCLYCLWGDFYVFYVCDFVYDFVCFVCCGVVVDCELCG